MPALFHVQEDFTVPILLMNKVTLYMNLEVFQL